jgi:hypothetical protein
MASIRNDACDFFALDEVLARFLEIVQEVSITVTKKSDNDKKNENTAEKASNGAVTNFITQDITYIITRSFWEFEKGTC